MTYLCDLGWKYKTDKCPQIKHHFTEFYDEMFREKRETVRTVVEIGIGCLAPYYVKGASLYMWREYFPNATIYGADIDPSMLFQDERIITLPCDQTKKEDLEKLVAAMGRRVDLFIDDGLHAPESQLFTALTVLPLLDNPVYVIEDAGRPYYLDKLADYNVRLLRHSRRKYRDDQMVVIEKRV